MSLHLQTYDSAHNFLDRAGPWLLRSEAEHSLMLGLAGRLAGAVPDGVAEGGPSAPYLTTVERGGAVVGVALRTPPHKLVLSRMPLAAVPLVAASAERFERLPAVLGPPGVAWAFGREWAQRRPVVPRAGMRQRVFELTRLVPPACTVAGRARLADAQDLDRVAGWIDAFHRGVGAQHAAEGHAWAQTYVGTGRVLLWDDAGLAAMAAEIARSPHGARVGAVYTPPALRGRGYASAVTAALSGRLLAGGLRFCSLYTDLANPTSNAIYQRLGYVPVADAVDVEFGG